MKRHEPEQLNMPDVPEEYELEDILREFGADSAPSKQDMSGDTITFHAVHSQSKPPAQDAASKSATPKREAENQRSALSETRRLPRPEEIKASRKVDLSDTQKLPRLGKEKKPANADFSETQRLSTVDFTAPAARKTRKPQNPPAAEPHREAPHSTVVRREAEAAAAVRKAPSEGRRRPPRREEKLPKVSPSAQAESSRSKARASEASVPEPPELLRRCKDGLGWLRVRLSLLGLAALLQLVLLFLTTLFSFDFLQRNGGWISLALTVFSVFMGIDAFVRGILDLLRVRISFFTLALPVYVLTLLHAVQTLPSIGYGPVATLLLFFLQRSLLQERSGLFYTLRTVCAFDSPMGVFEAPQLLKGINSLRRAPARMDEYMRCLLQPDRPQRFFAVYAAVILPLTGVLAYLFSVRSDSGFALAWLLLLLGAIPFCGTMCFSRPFHALAKRLSGFGGALCGWHSAKIFGGKHAIILRDEDLFPRGSVSSNGMKLYGEHRADRVISYALAALEAAENPLRGMFETLLHSQYGKHLSASAFRLYDDNGIGAEVSGDVVLVGTLGFMRGMGVHMPAGTRVRQAVYVSVNGELAGIFAVKYKPSVSTRKGLRDVLTNRSFSVVLATRDFLISPELIAAKYDLPTGTMIFPKFPERVRLSEIDPSKPAEQGALIAKDTFGAFASTVAAGRTLRTVSIFSLTLCALVGLSGLLVCALLIAWNSAAVASPLHIAAYQLLWAAVNTFLGFILLRF